MGNDSGRKLKAKSGWSDGGNGTDNFGFTALPGGYRNVNGTFNLIGNDGYWWSATENSASNAWFRHMSYFFVSNVIRNYNTEESGFSVRCVRD